MAIEQGQRPDVEAGHRLADLLPADSFAQVCGRGGLVVEARLGGRAALWRGHPWGTGWIGGGDPGELAELLGRVRPTEVTLPEHTFPEHIGLPSGYRRGWGWGWHAATTPPVQRLDLEEHVGWLDEQDEQLGALVARAFPDAETPPGDPRVLRWFGARSDGRLVCCAAQLRTAPGAALLSSLTVDPDVRRKGWGAAVTAWFVRERLAAGAVPVGLGTYLGNSGARALYTRLGFLDVPYLGAVREGEPSAR